VVSLITTRCHWGNWHPDPSVVLCCKSIMHPLQQIPVKTKNSTVLGRLNHFGYTMSPGNRTLRP